MNNFDKIISRIKEVEHYTTNKEVAELFELTPQEFSIRKKRGTLLPLVVNWGIKRKIDLTWLLTGDSEPSLKPPCKTSDKPTEAPSPSNVIEIEHADVIRRFRDKALARDINRNLVELEALRPEALNMANTYIKGLLDGARLTVAETQAYYDPDRRQVARRENDDPDHIPPAGDRRSGGDRRKAGG